MICTLYIGTDPEDVIRNAFACFDEEGTSKIHEDRLRELLTTMGDRFTDAEVCCLCVYTCFLCVCVCVPPLHDKIMLLRWSVLALCVHSSERQCVGVGVGERLSANHCTLLQQHRFLFSSLCVSL